MSGTILAPIDHKTVKKGATGYFVYDPIISCSNYSLMNSGTQTISGSDIRGVNGNFVYFNSPWNYRIHRTGKQVQMQMEAISGTGNGTIDILVQVPNTVLNFLTMLGLDPAINTGTPIVLSIAGTNEVGLISWTNIWISPSIRRLNGQAYPNGGTVALPFGINMNWLIP